MFQIRGRFIGFLSPTIECLAEWHATGSIGKNGTANWQM